ncbi:MAG TPA: hydrogenase formation protein HypD [Acidimicrobiales bacterium]|nr:hydrogenase formation protein HypD [Acidimicrobiales bacterium]
MRFVDEYRDRSKAVALAAAIAELCKPGRRYKIMEVCGGHTYTIYKHGLEHYLPGPVELVHGPGCPVCVIPMGRVDDAISIARREGVTMACFGDMMRVPGGKGSFLQAKAEGADVRVVYSPMDALKIALDGPGRQVVFMAIGFETTAPSTALTLMRAQAMGVPNFSVFCNHVTIIPPLRAILDAPDVDIDGFIGPGHVSAVIGCRPYEAIAKEYGRPLVVSGFEPLDILQSVYMLMRQLYQGRSEVENQYSRVVSWDGNRQAIAAIEATMEPRPHFEWRGLGSIPWSALKLRPHLARFDAEGIYEVPGVRVADPRACQCGQVLRGRLRPWECRVFAKACTPEKPIGTCMVSSEGACAAFYNFGRFQPARARTTAGTRP